MQTQWNEQEWKRLHLLPGDRKWKQSKQCAPPPPILNLRTNLGSRLFEAAVSGRVSFSTSPWVRLFQYEYVKGWKKWVYKDALFLWLWQADTKGRCVYSTVNANDSWAVFQKRKTVTTNAGGTRFPHTTFKTSSGGSKIYGKNVYIAAIMSQLWLWFATLFIF